MGYFRSTHVLFALLLFFVAGHLPAQSSELSDNEFLDMDISQLMQVTITSVSKKPERLSDAAAAVFVISNEDIRRSGATSFPEALRLVPGLHVAQISSSKWTVSSRGFSGQFSNKLLVLIDGRTVYTPAFSGVYWDMQGTLLEDVDRIEVIRGPGATLWGANAVNGVINIITKTSQETLGGLVRGSVGSHETMRGGVRYGWQLHGGITGRLYVNYDNFDSFERLATSVDGNDEWESLRGGFRIDGEIDTRRSWTLQGDVYSNDESQLMAPFWVPVLPYYTELKEDFDVCGWNVLAKYEQTFTDDAKLTVQLYYDSNEREETFLGQTHDTIDVDVQYGTQLGDHSLIMGLGYRSIDSDFSTTFQASITPSDRTDKIYSGFIQDTIKFAGDNLALTIGTKWEHNGYSGHELQPSGRLAWKINQSNMVWGAVSRAVRTTSQFESDGSLLISIDPTLSPFPGLSYFRGDGGFDSEELTAYEAGYRWMPSGNLSFDFAFFYNDYDMVMGVAYTDPTTPYDTIINNTIRGDGSGFELAVDWQPTQWLELMMGYSYLKMDLVAKQLYALRTSASVYNGSSPEHQFTLRADVAINPRWNLHVGLRYIDELEDASPAAQMLGLVIDDYWNCDVTMSYTYSENLEFMVGGKNLFHEENLEFVSEFFTPPTEIARSVFVQATYRF